MTLEYDQENQNLEVVAGIVDDYNDWFGLVVTAVSYPEEKNITDNIHKPLSFTSWVEKGKEDGSVAEEIIENLNEMHLDMMSRGELIIEIAASGNRPDYADFTDFKHLFDAFTGRLRRLERDSLAEGAGFDELTGLRNDKVMKDDLEKEMERVARNGSPFSIIYTRIDRFFTHEDKENVIRIVSNNIKKCMRTFDDAYYLGGGNFVISLKQADMIGATSATNRLQNFVKTDEENENNITLSYCMSEPVSGDDVEDLIANMKSDLDSFESDDDVVLKFVEVSPLQRYLDDLQG